MELQQTIRIRRSIRSYTNKPIPQETIRTLLNAAVQAPSAMNSQPWAFAVIQNAAALKVLSDASKRYLVSSLTDASPLAKYRDLLSEPNFDVFYGASTLVLILAKPNNPRPLEDCQLAAENLMLAACDNGLGTCFIGFANIYLDTPAGKKEQGIPEDYQVAATIVVGEPKEPLAPMDKKPPEVVFWKEA
ncbi:TPA: nitroreductase family protein [Candidatus Sumerlaeota bacterium]|jgi:nitroreductase|nr:nitroreductase family protein [Candidatus Sumerlaeota bacterium]